MVIYIYGSKKFKKDIKSILSKNNITLDLQEVSTLDKLKDFIKHNPLDIFLIDNDKIVEKSILHKIKFLKPKDAIEKEFLEKYGVGDICFNSMNGFVQYLLTRINSDLVCKIKDDNEIKNTEENEEFEFNESIQDQVEQSKEEEENQQVEQRDVANIICIDDIFETEMQEAIEELK